MNENWDDIEVHTQDVVNWTRLRRSYNAEKVRVWLSKINGKNISEIVPRLSLQVPQNKIALKSTQLGASVPRMRRSKIPGRLRKIMFAKGASKSF